METFSKQITKILAFVFLLSVLGFNLLSAKSSDFDIFLSKKNVDENKQVGHVVGYFSSTNDEEDHINNYKLVRGMGAIDNSFFNIVGDALKLNFIPDYEKRDSYKIRVALGDSEKQFVITINDLNNPPKDILLDNNYIYENQFIGKVVGKLSTVDDLEDTVASYSFGCDIKGTDDDKFIISDNLLKSNFVFDFDKNKSYEICIRVLDGSYIFDKKFTIKIKSSKTLLIDEALKSKSYLESIENNDKEEFLKINGEDNFYKLSENSRTCKNAKDIKKVFEVIGNNYKNEIPTKFRDLENSDFKKEIASLEFLDVVSGKDDNSFDPFSNITRSEFLAILLKSHCYNFDLFVDDLVFVDVLKDSWQAKVIKKAYDLGIVSGSINYKGEKIFNPNSPISKIEALAMLYNIGFSELKPKTRLKLLYGDVFVDWQKELVKKLEYLNILDAKSDYYTFNPNSKLTRESMVDYLFRTINLY